MIKEMTITLQNCDNTFKQYHAVASYSYSYQEWHHYKFVDFTVAMLTISSGNSTNSIQRGLLT